MHINRLLFIYKDHNKSQYSIAKKQQNEEKHLNRLYHCIVQLMCFNETIQRLGDRKK